MPQLSTRELFEPDGSLQAGINIGGHKAGGGGTGVGRVGGKMHLEDVSMGIINPRVILRRSIHFSRSLFACTSMIRP